MSTDVGTWTNWLTFEPDPDHSPDAGTGLLSPISCKRVYAEFYVGKIPLAACHQSKPWFSNGFIHWAVGSPLSEVNALYRVPFWLLTAFITERCREYTCWDTVTSSCQDTVTQRVTSSNTWCVVDKVPTQHSTIARHSTPHSYDVSWRREALPVKQHHPFGSLLVNSHLVCDPTIRQPGFDLPRQQWSLLNRFRTEQGHCGASRRKWRLTDTDLYPCGETQTMSHIVEPCPLTKLNGGLSRLHSADEDAVSWLTNYGKWHAYEKKKTWYVVDKAPTLNHRQTVDASTVMTYPGTKHFLSNNIISSVLFTVVIVTVVVLRHILHCRIIKPALETARAAQCDVC